MTNFIKLSFLFILLIIWFILTVGLAISFIGWILITPLSSNSYKSQAETRSTWMRIGFDLTQQIINL